MMEEKEALQTLSALARKMPTTATLIQSRLAQLQSAALEAELMMEEQLAVPSGETTAEPKQQTKTSPNEKQKGPTKGNV